MLKSLDSQTLAHLSHFSSVPIQVVSFRFLLAAKSIMRFNDTRTAKRPVSEYVLLGTLLSFTFSLMVGIGLSGVLSS